MFTLSLRVREIISSFLILAFFATPFSTFGYETNKTFSSTSNYYGENVTIENTDVSSEYVSTTGAFSYNIPIEVPQGVNGMTPEFSLGYSSQNLSNESIYGYGWSDSIPFIVRENKTGVNNMYDDLFFSSSISGDLTPVAINKNGYGTYTARSESTDFLKYQFVNDVWEVYTTSGIKYVFGKDSSARLENPNSSSQITKWYLSEIRDSNDNTIIYTYQEDSVQVYPEKISYTGHGDDEGDYAINFSYATSTAYTSYAYGYPVTTNRVIDDLDVTYKGELARTYNFEHVISDDSKRAMLSSYKVIGYGETETTVSPQETFTYSESNLEFERDESIADFPVEIWENPQTQNPTLFLDYDKNGIPEIYGTYSKRDGSDRYYGYAWNSAKEEWEGFVDTQKPYIAQEYFYDRDIAFGNLDHKFGVDKFRLLAFDGNAEDYYHTDGGKFYVSPSNTLLTDLNGDGMSDLLQVSDDSIGSVIFNVPLENNSQWQVAEHSRLWHDLGGGFDEGAAEVRTPDLNGDGLADIVDKRYISLNNGAGQTVRIGDIPGITPRTEKDPMEPYQFSDINGDGIIDILLSNGNTDKVEIYIQKLDGTFVLHDSGEQLGLFARYDNPPCCREYVATGRWLYDVDQDGLDDMLVSRPDNNGIDGSYALINKSEQADRLVSIKTNAGAVIDIEYQRTTEQYTSDDTLAHPQLVTPLDVVTRISLDSGLGNVQAYTYEYTNGKTYSESLQNRGFAGFETISKTDVFSGKQAKTYYHQGDTDNTDLQEKGDNIRLVNKPYKTEVVDTETAQVYSQEFITWDVNEKEVEGAQALEHYSDAYFVAPKTTVTAMHQGGESVYTAQTYTYDISFGGVIETIDWGQVEYDQDAGTFTDVLDDKRTVSTEYAIDKFKEMPFLQENGFVAVTSLYEARYGVVGSGNHSVDSTYITNQNAGALFTVGIYSVYPAGYSNDYSRAYFEFDPVAAELISDGDEIVSATLSLRTHETERESEMTLFDSTCSQTIPKTDMGWLSCNLDSSAISNTQQISRLDRQSVSLKLNDEGLEKINENINNNKRISLLIRPQYDAQNKITTNEVDEGRAKFYGPAWEKEDRRPHLNLVIAKDIAEDVYRYLPVKTITYNNSEEKIAETINYYDNKGYAEIGDQGNLTKSKQWLDGDNSGIETEYDHNERGLVTKITDPKGNETYMEYDASDLFVAEQTNELGHTTTYAYDFAIGKISQTSDANNSKMKRVFDGLGRVVAEYQTDTDGALRKIQETSYVDVGLPRSVITSAYHQENPYRTYKYLDGFRRVVQSKQETTNPGEYAVVKNNFDDSGRIISVTQPYTSAVSTFELSVPDVPMQSISEYDVFDRHISLQTPLGIHLYEYVNPLQITETNPRGVSKQTTKDIRGNIAKVVEDSKGEKFVTSYTYDEQNNLIKIVDAEGNEREFEFDSLARQTMSELPHIPGVGAATYRYEYDKSGNKVLEILPDGTKMRFTYDAINRVLTKDSDRTQEVDAQYSYDEGDNAIGYITNRETKDHSISYTYDKAGNVINEELLVKNYTPQEIDSSKELITENNLPSQDNIQEDELYEPEILPEELQEAQEQEDIQQLVDPVEEIQDTDEASEIDQTSIESNLDQSVSLDESSSDADELMREVTEINIQDLEDVETQTATTTEVITEQATSTPESDTNSETKNTQEPLEVTELDIDIDVDVENSTSSEPISWIHKIMGVKTAHAQEIIITTGQETLSQIEIIEPEIIIEPKEPEITDTPEEQEAEESEQEIEQEVTNLIESSATSTPQDPAEEVIFQEIQNSTSTPQEIPSGDTDPQESQGTQTETTTEVIAEQATSTELSDLFDPATDSSVVDVEISEETQQDASVEQDQEITTKVSTELESAAQATSTNSYNQSNEQLGVFNTSYTFDRWGNVTSVMYPDNSVISYEYYDAGLLERVTKDGEILVEHEYDHLGNITKKEFGNEIIEQYSYDRDKGYLLKNKTIGLEYQALESYEYLYDKVGNITNITDSGSHNPHSNSYTYDSLDRLIVAQNIQATSIDDLQRKQDLREIAKALDSHYQEHGTFQVDAGKDDLGDGWFAYEKPNSVYTQSVAEELYEQGHADQIIVDPTGAKASSGTEDHSGYVIMTSDGSSYTIWANLDDPTAQDLATMDTCLQSDYDNYHANYPESRKINYCISGDVNGLIENKSEKSVYTYSETGNMLSHNGNMYTYGNDVFPHAATSFGTTAYTYDANGNLESKDDTVEVSNYMYDWNDRLAKIMYKGPGYSTNPTDLQRKNDLRDIAHGLARYHDQHGTFKVQGAGSRGEGNGWFAYEKPNSVYTQSVAEELYEQGHTDRIIVDPTGAKASSGTKDHSGYMIVTGEGSSYTLWANLDDPTAQDLATMDECIHSNFDNYSSSNPESRQMNYCVSGDVEGVIDLPYELASYTYDDQRQRLSKTVGGQTDYFINSATEFNGLEYQTSIFAGNNRVAHVGINGVLTYNHQDHLQSSSLQTDASGDVTTSVIYKPFGSELSRTGTSSSPYTYTDHYSDDETGLLYMNSRYYDPELKRFTSVDAWRGELDNPQTLNKYSYVGNNPLKYTDPTGNYWESAIDAIFLGLSINAYNNNPTFVNGAFVALDGAGLALPIPAVAGYIKNGAKATQMYKYFSKVSQQSGTAMTSIAGTYAQKALSGFKQNGLQWSTGGSRGAGDSLGGLVGHFHKHKNEFAHLGITSVDDYYQGANKLINSVDNKNVFKITGEKANTTNYVNKTTGEYVSVNNKTNDIATYMIPTSQTTKSHVAREINKISN